MLNTLKRMRYFYTSYKTKDVITKLAKKITRLYGMFQKELYNGIQNATVWGEYYKNVYT
jgi:hypothetical protein